MTTRGGGDGVDSSQFVVLVLGPCAVATDDWAPAELTTVQRRIVGRLAFGASDAVDASELIDAVWGSEPPATARAALANQISRLRKRFGADFVVTTGSRYRLGVPIDADLVADEVAAAERALVGAPVDAARAFGLADGALGRWRGTPFGDIDDRIDVAAARRRLSELRSAAENIRLQAGIALGRVGWAVPEAERMVAENPLDERRWVLLVEALDATGRRGDALGAVERARTVLRDQLGISPGRGLRAALDRLLEVEPAGVHPRPRTLVGREGELAAVLVAARAGTPTFITGEDGIGKTQLLVEAARALRGEGMVVATATCSANPAAAGEILVELLDDLGRAPDPVLGPVDGFVSVIRDVREQAPLALCLDDLHLIGPSSLGALDGAAALDRVSLVVTVDERSAMARARAGAVHVPLVGIPPEAVAELASEALSGRELEPETIERLAEMSGGNPLFLECMLEDEALLTVLREHPEGGVPEDVARSEVLSGLVRRRLEPLTNRARAGIEVLAVGGRRAPVSVVAAIAAGSDLAEAMSTGLVEVSDGWIQFRHGAVQRVVYCDLPPGRRLELHHAIGSRLARAGSTATTVAHHLLAAAELEPLTAVAVAQAAAGEASDRGAHLDAAQWASRAADIAERLGPDHRREAIASRILEGDARRLAGDPSHEAVLLEAAERATELGDATLMGEAAFALLQLGASSESGGLDEPAVAFAQRAMREVADPELRATLMAASSLAHSMSGEADRCRELFVRAERTATDRRTRQTVLPFAYLALGHPTDLELRERLTAELLASAAQDGNPVARFEGLHLSFSGGLQLADGPRVRAALAEMRDLVDRVGDVGRRWALAYQSAAVAHLEDDLTLSERLTAEAFGLFAPVSASRALAVYSAQLLVIRLAQGRVGELADTAADLVVQQPGVPAWHAALALTTAGEDPDLSRRHARMALADVPKDFTWLAAHLTGGRAAALVGDPDTRAEYRRRLERWSGRVCWQGTFAYGPVDTVLAMLASADGDAVAARAYARRARELARSLQAPVFDRDLDELGLG